MSPDYMARRRSEADQKRTLDALGTNSQGLRARPKQVKTKPTLLHVSDAPTPALGRKISPGLRMRAGGGDNQLSKLLGV